jgi:hypothetical protein
MQNPANTWNIYRRRSRKLPPAVSYVRRPLDTRLCLNLTMHLVPRSVSTHLVWLFDIVRLNRFIAHPINNVIQTPGASSISLSSTSATQRGTYTVTVHRRQQHALTEFPHANPPMSDDYTTPHDSPRSRSKSIPFFPRDSNCLQGLRQDPSVASLLNMYDEHGCLPPSAFSNTPPSPAKEGRVQARRNGSTLRQLLGNPSSRSRGNVDSSAMEGDISWAERCLG